MKKEPHLLKVSLHGMNTRVYKMMVNFLEITCKSIASVVEESESEIEIIDADLTDSKSLIEERLLRQPSKPIIVLSLHKISFDNIIYVKKPIDVLSLKKALKTAKNNTLSSKKKTAEKTKVSINKLMESPADKARKINFKNSSKSFNAKQLLTDAPKIDTSLKGLDNTAITLKDIEKKNEEQKKQYSRTTIRHSFSPIEAKIKSESLINLNGDLPVLVLNLDSQGALIELKKSLKLPEEIILDIQFDLQHSFDIPARVVRKESNNTFGLEFLDPQYELSDYLV
jgi:hypothetical protein